MVIFARSSHTTVTLGFRDDCWGKVRMWMITRDEAIEMYARFLAARHGGAASRIARKIADKLQTKGDFEGHAVWNLVADAVERRSFKKAELESVTPVS
jgi:hypothetical protein